MKIEIGKVCVNKTSQFLLPCLADFGTEFKCRFNNTTKLAFGIHDTLLEGSLDLSNKCIHVLFYTKTNVLGFEKLLNWLKLQPQYVMDYCPEPSLKLAKTHMIVLSVPEKYNETYDLFLKGKYSMMYKKADLERLFKNRADKTAYNTILKTPETGEKFRKRVNSDFKTDIKAIKGEYDYPLRFDEEIFNFNTETKSVFFKDKFWNTEHNKYMI